MNQDKSGTHEISPCTFFPAPNVSKTRNICLIIAFDCCVNFQSILAKFIKSINPLTACRKTERIFQKKTSEQLYHIYIKHR